MVMHATHPYLCISYLWMYAVGVMVMHATHPYLCIASSVFARMPPTCMWICKSVCTCRRAPRPFSAPDLAFSVVVAIAIADLWMYAVGVMVMHGIAIADLWMYAVGVMVMHAIAIADLFSASVPVPCTLFPGSCSPLPVFPLPLPLRVAHHP